MLPVLGALLARAREAAGTAGVLDGEMQELSHRIFLSGGLHVDVAAAARRRAERDKAIAEARSAIEEVEELGVRVVDAAEGLLEIPCLGEGRVVLLCWTLGEDRITQWRELEDEASVRREVGDGFSRRDRERLN